MIAISFSNIVGKGILFMEIHDCVEQNLKPVKDNTNRFGRGIKQPFVSLFPNQVHKQG